MSDLTGVLGLAARAGALKTGEAVCERLIKSAGAVVALVDMGASERSRKDMRDACEYAQVPLVELEPGMLGRSIGKPGRMAAAITDKGFGEKILQMVSIRERGGARWE